MLSISNLWVGSGGHQQYFWMEWCCFASFFSDAEASWQLARPRWHRISQSSHTNSYVWLDWLEMAGRSPAHLTPTWGVKYSNPGEQRRKRHHAVHHATKAWRALSTNATTWAHVSILSHKLAVNRNRNALVSDWYQIHQQRLSSHTYLWMYVWSTIEHSIYLHYFCFQDHRCLSTFIDQCCVIIRYKQLLHQL